MTSASTKPKRGYTRHGMTAPIAKVNLRGFDAIDRRTAGARATLAFRRELVAALGGEAELSPQRTRLVDLAARAALLVDHVDAWIFAQTSLVNGRMRTLLPVVVQRQAIAEHLAKLLDRLGLDRMPTKVRALHDYIERTYAGKNGTTPAATAPSTTTETEGTATP